MMATNMDCTPNMTLVALAATFAGARSIIQLWITGRAAYMTNPSTETPAMKRMSLWMTVNTKIKTVEADSPASTTGRRPARSDHAPAMGEATYGLGVLVTENDDGRMVWHGGGIEGFNAMLMHDPDDAITVVVLANINGGQAGALGQQLMELARGGDVVLANERVEGSVDTAALPQYEGTFALSPQFKIRMFVEDGKLMTQATNQPAFQLFPGEEADHFFLKVVDARVRFNRDDSGEVVSITLFQGGQEIDGAKE